ncbi:transposase [Cyanobium sp. ATX 6F1]|uniref:transposase n=1 Tax=unclassified Cyanobium TaxID=2627006 RepID=UPI00396572B9
MVRPKSFRPWNPEQTLLLPPSPVDWLPENSLVFFLLDLAAELDLEAIHAVYRQKDPRGEKAYEPRMIVVLLLYAYCVGLPSSRKIEKTCWEDAAFRVLTGNQQPDHSRYCYAEALRLQRFSPAPSHGFGRLVCSGAAAVPEGGAGELGSCGAGWHQGQSQRQQAQGHESRADAQEREAAGSRNAGAAAQGRDHRRPGRRPVRQREAG